MTYVTEVTADAPVLWHRMENNTNNSGSLSPTITASLSTYVLGQYGNAGSFTGTNYIQDATTNAYYGTEWAVEAWFKCNSSADYNTIVRRSGSQHVLLRVRGPGIGVEPNKLECYVAGNSGSVTSFTGPVVNDNAWHHTVLTQEGSSIKMYVDGALVASGASVGTISSLTAAQQIGREASGTEYFYGTLDEVAIYNHALSSTRVSAHYNPPVVVTYKGWGLPL